MEPATGYEGLQTRIRELDGSVLTEIRQQIGEKSVQLHFKHWDERPLIVHCGSVLACNMSRIEQKTEDAEVIRAELEVLEDGGKELLENVGYLWNTDRSEGDYLEYPLMHFSINGETSLAIVCRTVEFL